MENMELWNKVSEPPKEAMKKIGGGNLAGFTDINPQWRYKALTEHFGPYGKGWKYTVDRKWSEPGVDGTMMAFADISLVVRYDQTNEPWCDPIPGHGGSMLIIKDKNGLHASDEAYKMAITDALSTACKMLGIGSAVYEGKMDTNRPTGTKYDRSYDQTPQEPRQNAGNAPRSQPNPRPPSAPQAQRPASRPPAQPQQQPSGVPTTGQVNHGLKTGAQVAGNQASITSEVITAEQFDALKGAAYKARVPIRQWKAWLKGLYGYEGSAEIKKTQYATILGILTKTPKVIINYGKSEKPQGEDIPVEPDNAMLPEPEGN